MLAEAKSAGLMMNARFIIVETYSGRGLMAKDPKGVRAFHALDVSNELLGASIAEALHSSRWISMDEYAAYFDRERLERQSEDWIATIKELHGYKTRKAVFTGMANCSITERDGVVTIRPSNHEKLEGWSGKGITAADHVVLPSASSTAELGEGARLALSRCK